MKTITCRITLEIFGEYTGNTTRFPACRPSVREITLDRKTAAAEMKAAFATLEEEFADQVAEARARRIAAIQRQRLARKPG